MRKGNSLRAALNPSSPSTPSITPYVVSLGVVQHHWKSATGTDPTMLVMDQKVTNQLGFPSDRGGFLMPPGRRLSHSRSVTSFHRNCGVDTH